MGTEALWVHLEEFDTSAPSLVPPEPLRQLELGEDVEKPEPADPVPDLEELRQAAWEEGYQAAKSEYELLVEQARSDAQEQFDAERKELEAADLSSLSAEMSRAYENLEVSINETVRAICLPFLNELAQERCFDDFTEVVRMLLSDSCTVEISGPSEQLASLKTRLSDTELAMCSFVEDGATEVRAVCGETRLQASLTAWLERTVKGEDGNV